MVELDDQEQTGYSPQYSCQCVILIQACAVLVFAATHVAGFVDFGIRQALLRAVRKMGHSEVAVDTQQTSTHIVL